MDIDNITNQELIQALTVRGVNVGGINATTRNLYINKLKKLLKEDDGDNSPTINGGGDNLDINGYHDEEHDETHEEQASRIYPDLGSNARKSGKKQPTPALVSDEAEESDYGEESSRFLTEEEMRHIREESYYRRSPSRANESSMTSTVLKALGIILAAVFIYFVLDNANKIPGNHESL